MISPGERGADGAATLVGAAGAAGSSGRGRGTDALSVTTTGFTGASAPLNIGAGCEPDCRNSTLIRIAIVTKTPSTTPTASRPLQPSARNSCVARSTDPLFPGRTNGCADFPIRSRIGPTFPCTPDDLGRAPLFALSDRVRARLSER